RITPLALMRRSVMRMRLAAPLLAAVAGLFGAVQSASAGPVGASGYGGCPEPWCDAQCCFPSCCQQGKTCYRLADDAGMEKRWETCYQTVCETCYKNVCKTCYREECKTCMKNVCETCYRDECYTVCRPVCHTTFKEVCETVCRPHCETCYKQVPYTICKR